MRASNLPRATPVDDTLQPQWQNPLFGGRRPSREVVSCRDRTTVISATGGTSDPALGLSPHRPREPCPCGSRQRWLEVDQVMIVD
jgi:hypothetical protein